ncbi:MAG: DsbA family protein [Gammaproteobacteria bacterium]|nr:MAG: DsbA family protein [Gammaproteobacteria bacterium]
MTVKVYIVTDPMCSWCWGMTPQIKIAAERLADRVEFDLLLGGINTHGSQPIGDYGKRHLFKLWKEVHATTSQSFGFKLPETFVYNSTIPCIAVAAMSRWLGKPAFDYLHRLQQLFFLEGLNINEPGLLADAAQDRGWTRDGMVTALSDINLREVVRFEFSTSRSYGTNALPSVLWEETGKRVLLAGGYVDADMLVQLIQTKLDGISLGS